MTTLSRYLAVAMLASPILGAGPVRAQTVVDGSDTTLGPEAHSVIALVGKGLKVPETARYGRLRTGRAGAICGEVDTTNRMGQHVGPRSFVADVGAGFAGIVPDGAELRNPASMGHYGVMQRILALFAANCAA
ncbi:hypothetical protein G3T14_04430 [Methylobacterium sp. BTF04]|uniref:hypothetical protein n=1 Tax=Methylobacterium sp. BTF04 TaxID=2708300 RepID=UPI0013D32E49|nr:hypothetical protein [Methylobacterium sp. BTF04]NEU11372.1 hypothetical protein [Methylobacterium sp. BTF04]